MGQAFDRDGVVLGEAEGATKREVFEKLHREHNDAHEIRIKSIVTDAARKAAGVPVDEIENIFTYHTPFGSQPQRYEHLRTMAKNLAYNIHASCPPSRERSLALTSLQQAIMWANASIAINEKEPKQDL